MKEERLMRDYHIYEHFVEECLIEKAINHIMMKAIKTSRKRRGSLRTKFLQDSQPFRQTSLWSRETTREVNVLFVNRSLTFKVTTVVYAAHT